MGANDERGDQPFGSMGTRVRGNAMEYARSGLMVRQNDSLLDSSSVGEGWAGKGRGQMTEER
jgi:hypothetical protein